MDDQGIESLIAIDASSALYKRAHQMYPRLERDEPQIIYDGPPSELDKADDRRVRQFIHGEAGERLTELRESRASNSTNT